MFVLLKPCHLAVVSMPYRQTSTQNETSTTNGLNVAPGNANMSNINPGASHLSAKKAVPAAASGNTCVAINNTADANNSSCQLLSKNRLCDRVSRERHMPQLPRSTPKV